MGFRGDAMKASTKDLEALFELQSITLTQRSLLQQAQELSKGGRLEVLRSELAELSEQLSELRLANEELKRELKRMESDLQVVEARIARDTERLNHSSNAKDIAGIQHELETLARRKSDLEDSELEIMEQLEASDRAMHEVEQSREQKETEIEQAKREISLELEQLKSENKSLSDKASSLKASASSELLALFEAKLAKGLAVGRLSGSTCSACNMSLNSQAMAEVSKVPADELATCPECSAMLVRA